MTAFPRLIRLKMSAGEFSLSSFVDSVLENSTIMLCTNAARRQQGWTEMAGIRLGYMYRERTEKYRSLR